MIVGKCVYLFDFVKIKEKEDRTRMEEIIQEYEKMTEEFQKKRDK